MVERIDIERALDEIMSYEEGMRFQNLAVVLAKIRWPELIACERHKDQGLEAYASPASSRDGRGKGVASSTTPKVSKISSDAKTAKEHYDGLSLLIFVTPGKVTKKSEESWRNEIRERHDLDLVIISREDIITTLQLPQHAAICRTHLKIAATDERSISDLAENVRTPVAAVIAGEARRLGNRPRIALTVTVLDDSGLPAQNRFPVTELASALLRGRRVVIEAPAGRGKTTALMLIAEASADEGTPIIVDLPAFVRAGGNVLDFVAQHPAYRARGIDAADLARLAAAHPFLFLLNGWNEISEASSSDALIALAALEREFPSAGILVVTRAHHVHPPLPGALRLHLLPLTPAQRAKYISDALPPDKTADLRALFASDRTLDDVTRTPLILAEVTQLYAAGRNLPRTTFGVLGAVVRMQEEAVDHHGALATQPLVGCAEFYLREMAMEMTARNEVIIAEPEARSICRRASEKLRERGQIVELPEPNGVLATLVAHHVLERVEFKAVSFRFQHQQFQEYYASVGLRSILRTIHASEDAEHRRTFARSFLNVPAWEEPLLMLASAFGDAEDEIALAQILVNDTLPIDPVFAAHLARTGGALVWDAVRNGVHARLRGLYASSDPYHVQLSVAGMVATASEEFGDILVPRLTNPELQIRHETYRSGAELLPTCVGTDWPSIVSLWPEERRIEFLSHLALDSGNLEPALIFAKTDPAVTVRIEAIRTLLWMRRYDAAADLLRRLADEDFMRAIESTDYRELSEDLRTRAFDITGARFANTHDPTARFRLALSLVEEGDADGARLAKDALATLTPELIRELNTSGSLWRAAEAVRRIDEVWISEWVAERIAEGSLWPERWRTLVTTIPEALRERLFQAVRSETELRDPGAVAVLGVTASATFAARAFDILREHDRADPRDEGAYAIMQRLEALVRAIPARIVVQGLESKFAADPANEDLDVLLNIFGEARRDDGDPTLPEAERQQLRRYLTSAVPLVLSREDFGGEAKAHLALALAAVGDVKASEAVRRLIRADIERVRVGRDLRKSGDRSPRAEGASMIQAHFHVEALLRLDAAAADTDLLKLLREPEYELDAAWGLRELAKLERSEWSTMAGRFGVRRPDYRVVHHTPREWERLFNGERRAEYACAIAGRIRELLDESVREQTAARSYRWRARQLAQPLAALDPRGSADVILEVAELPPDVDTWSAVSLLEALIFGGVTLSADRVLGIVEPVVAHIRSRGMYSENAGLVQRIACILPFIDSPERGLARMRELFAEFPVAAYDQRDILTALGQCRHTDSVVLLADVARQSGARFEHIAREWFDAVASSSAPEARELLLSFVDPKVPNGFTGVALRGDAPLFLADVLSEVSARDKTFSTQLLAVCKTRPSLRERAVLARACGRLGTSEALDAALYLLDDEAERPIPFEVFSALEELFLEKRRDARIANAYSLVPRAASDIRARLWEMATHDRGRRRSASELLARIDAWRLEYGRPPGEPRHPGDLSTVWPLPVHAFAPEESV